MVLEIDIRIFVSRLSGPKIGINSLRGSSQANWTPALAGSACGLSLTLAAVSLGWLDSSLTFSLEQFLAPVVFVARMRTFRHLGLDVLQSTFELDEGVRIDRTVQVEKGIEILDLYFLSFTEPVNLNGFLPREAYRASLGGYFRRQGPDVWTLQKLC